MNKLFKILMLFLISLLVLSSFDLKINAADDNCMNWDRTIGVVKDRYYKQCEISENPDETVCENLENQIAEYEAEACADGCDQFCSGPPPCPYEVPFDVVPIAGGSMKVDGSPFYFI